MEGLSWGWLETAEGTLAEVQLQQHLIIDQARRIVMTPTWNRQQLPQGIRLAGDEQRWMTSFMPSQTEA